MSCIFCRFVQFAPKASGRNQFPRPASSALRNLSPKKQGQLRARPFGQAAFNPFGVAAGLESGGNDRHSAAPACRIPLSQPDYLPRLGQGQGTHGLPANSHDRIDAPDLRAPLHRRAGKLHPLPADLDAVTCEAPCRGLARAPGIQSPTARQDRVQIAQTVLDFSFEQNLETRHPGVFEREPQQSFRDALRALYLSLLP